MSPKAKRTFLMTLLGGAGVVLVACFGLAVFGGSRNVTEICFSIGPSGGFGLLMIFAAFTAVDRPFWRVVAFTGIVFAIVAMLHMIGLLIMEPILGVWHYYPNDHRFEWAYTTMSTAAFFCMTPWIGALRMKGLGRAAQIVALTLLGALYTLMLFVVWGSFASSNTEGIIFGLWLLTGGMVLVVFVLNKFFSLKVPDPLTQVDQSLQVRCPRCLKEQQLPVGESNCAFCGLRFKIEFEEPRCRKCNYNLRELTRPICPECGTAILEGAGAAPESALAVPEA